MGDGVANQRLIPHNRFMRRGVSIIGWLLIVSFILLLITVRNLYLISKLSNQQSGKVNIPTENQIPSVSVNSSFNKPPDEIWIIPQNPLVRSYGTLEFVLLQYLTLEKYEVNGSTAILDLKYWLNQRPHTLKLEVIAQFGTDKGLDKVKDGVFGNKYKVGDTLNIALSYLSPQNYPGVNSKKIGETEVDAINLYGLFGDKPISLDQLKTILLQDKASLDSATVIVETISIANSKP